MTPPDLRRPSCDGLQLWHRWTAAVKHESFRLHVEASAGVDQADDTEVALEILLELKPTGPSVGILRPELQPE